MTIPAISHLLRYPFTILILTLTIMMIRFSLVQLRRDMRSRTRPVPGSRLMTGKPSMDSLSAESPDKVRVLQLWHTTVIGRVEPCDVRLEGPTVGRRHATLYLYESKWFLRPASRHHEVRVNGVIVRKRTLLHNLDQIRIGSHDLAFLDDRKTPDTAVQDQETDDFLPDHLDAPSRRRFGIAWLAALLLSLLSGMVMVLLVPANASIVRLWIGGYVFGFFLLLNLLIAFLPKWLPHVDRIPLLCLMALVSLGMLFQVRLALAGLPTGANLLPPELLEQTRLLLLPQGSAYALGLLLFPPVLWLVARTRLPEPLGILGAVATPVLLLATLLYGRGGDTHGATLWIDVGGVSFQLTEFSKITYLFVLAWFFKHRPGRGLQTLFAVWAAVSLGLVMLLPDLGTALILVPATLLVFVVMTSEYGTTLAILGVGTGLGSIAYVVFPHVRRRLAGWTSLWTEVNDGNRQIVYALQAIARGGLTGRGVGNGSPDGIPLASSDMIFALVCEELGILTGLCLLVLFIVLWLRAARVVLTGQDGFTASLALGIGTLLFMEAAIVIAGVTGLLPLTGATLPLIARGGSSVLAKMLLFALLVGLSARRESLTQNPERRKGGAGV